MKIVAAPPARIIVQFKIPRCDLQVQQYEYPFRFVDGESSSPSRRSTHTLLCRVMDRKSKRQRSRAQNIIFVFIAARYYYIIIIRL